MKTIIRTLRNPYVQWTLIFLIAAAFLWMGITAIIAEDKLIKGN